MANTIAVKITNSEVTTFLSSMLDRLTHPSDLMASVAQELLTQTELRIHDEGPGWPQLKPATVKRRGSAHPILQVTGALARSFTTDYGDDFAAIGSNIPYAAIHQFGGQISIAARSQQAYFKQDKKSGAVGQRFVKKSKSNFAQNVTIPAHEITIEPRPMLPIDDQGNLLPNTAAIIMEMLANYVIE